MDEWVIWLIFAVVLGVAEIFTLTAALGVLGAAALVTAVSAAILPLPFQLIVFTAAATAGVILIRPIALRHMHQPQLERFGVDALVGKPAYASASAARSGPHAPTTKPSPSPREPWST